jgi:hypothetical protein
MVGLDHVRWAYRLLLDREPESLQAMISRAAEFSDPQKLVASLLYSNERRMIHATRYFEELDTSLIDVYARHDRTPEIGFVKDFIGVRTAIGMAAWIFDKSHTLEGRPFPGNFYGDLPEWVGFLTGLHAALHRDPTRLRMLELGTAWGPWLAAGGVIARDRGATQFSLVGVEAAQVHLDRFRAHMEANGFGGESVAAVHAVVSPQAGWASFPKIVEPALEFGFAARNAGPARPDETPDCDVVSTITLEQALADHGSMDLVVCTIVGGEETALFTQAADRLAEVGAVMIATTSRDTDSELWSLFKSLGWRLAVDQPCSYWQDQDDSKKFHVRRDGCQAWINPHPKG